MSQFDEKTVNDRHRLSYRDTGDNRTKQAVEVENDSSNPIPVFITESSGDPIINVFAEVSSIAAALETTVLTYTVPVGKTLNLDRIDGSGENVARYDIYIDSVREARKRSWWTAFNVCFEFHKIELVAGQVLEMKVLHNSSAVGDFEGRLVGLLI